MKVYGTGQLQIPEKSADSKSVCPVVENVFITSVADWERFFYHAYPFGHEEYPAIVNKLPFSGQGAISPEDAADILLDLARLEAQKIIGYAIFLVNSATGEKLFRSDDEMNDVKRLGSWNYGLWFDREGIYVRQRINGDEVEIFRSKKVEQKVIDATSLGYPGATVTELTAVEGTEKVIVPLGFPALRWEGSACIATYPAKLHVEGLPLTPLDFQGMVDSLRQICGASVQTGRAIWLYRKPYEEY